MGGIELMTRVHERFPEVSFVMVIEPENLRNGILAMISGASDYILTPLEPDTVVLSVNRALQRRRIESALAKYQRKLDFGQCWSKQQ
jgi:DNA-binding NtrC family response regulator